LWDWWLATEASSAPGGLDARDTRDLREQLVARMPQASAEAHVAHIIDDPQSPVYERWHQLLAVLPTPWSAAFGTRFIAALRAAVATLARPREDSSQWLAAIETACAALPEACFALALDGWEVPEPEDDGKGKHTYDHYTLYSWKDHLERLSEALRIRQSLFAEIRVEEHPV
jgi:hypothetical protein